MDKVTTYIRPDADMSSDWNEVPDEIRDTFDKLGIQEAEKEMMLSGVGAQYDWLTKELYIQILIQLLKNMKILLKNTLQNQSHQDYTNMLHFIMRYGQVDHLYMFQKG